MAPVVELNDRPLGMEGLMAHDVALPPPMAGVVVVIVVPFSKRQVVSAVHDGVWRGIVDGDVERG